MRTKKKKQKTLINENKKKNKLARQKRLFDENPKKLARWRVI
jgi:hypothetical protein